MLKRLSFRLLISFIIVSTINGQPLRFSHLTLKDGLPNSLVFSIAQDRNGFIWLGTNNGLARYDGYNFRVFKPNSKKPHSISDKSIFRVFCDKKGNLWASIQGKGLNRMDLKTEQFYYYFPDTINKSSISGNDIRSIFEDKDSALWVASNKGLDLYDTRYDRFIHFLTDQQIKQAGLAFPLKEVFSDSEGGIWFLTEKSIGQIDKKLFNVKSLGVILKRPELDKIQIYGAIPDSKGNIWFCTERNGLFCVSLKERRISNYFTEIPNLRNLFIDKKGNLYVYADRPLNKLFVVLKADFAKENIQSFSMFDGPNVFGPVRFAEDKSGDIYITSDQGFNVYKPGKEIVTYQSNEYLPGALMGNHIQTLFIDNTENLWVSIARKGIDKADLRQKPFKWYVSDPLARSKSLAGNNVILIHEDRVHNLWIGCFEEGLTRYNRVTNTFATIPIELDNPSKLNFNAPSALYEDADGYLWLGFYDGQLDKIDPKTFKISHYKWQSWGTPYFFEGNGIRKILGDKSGNIWFASTTGIIEMKKQTGEFIYHSRLYDKNYETNYLYRTMYIDNQDVVWSGTQNGGLIKYEKSIKKFTYYQTDPNDKQSISSNLVYAINEDKDGTMWIGTSLGLNKFDKITGKFTRIGTKEGLGQYAIYSILPDTLGNFWMSSDAGLLRFNKTTLDIAKYIEDDGLISGEFNTMASCRASNGELFFGTPRGLVSFTTSTIATNPYSARPTITDLKIFSKSISPGDTLNKRVILHQQIWATKEIQLKYRENDFTLEFSGLHYASPKKIQYYYKLEGFNKDWVNVDATRHWAVFTGLEPGNYLFRLKATNNDNLLCKPEDEVVLRIIIIPPFYKTIWFKLLMLFMVIVATLFYNRQRLIRLRRQKVELEIKVKERTKELQEANVNLEERQEEIVLQKDELMTQRNRLEEANLLLEEQKKQITDQNKELDRHRNELALLVMERTRDLERALNKAEEADRLKTAFLANMSHEIRTPMNAIIGFSRLLRENDSEEKKKEFIDIINNNGEMLMVLINDILDLSKIQANQMELYPLPLKIIPFLEELNNSFSVDAKRKGLTLQLNKNNVAENFTFLVDKVRFKQVIINLITNAIKFTQKGGVEFGVFNEDVYLKFYVKDTGIGIPANIGNSIFRRFLKIEDDKDMVFGGTGLGLAICKSLVDLWGGEIWYESELEVGSTFYFTYPVHPANEILTKQSAVVNEDKQIPGKLNSKTILIAEDEEDNFLLIQAYLKKTGIKIHWVRNGSDAIQFVDNQMPDIILLDIKMPVMSGVEALKIIKEKNPELPIIAHTAFAYEKEIKEFLASGFDDYITKPVQFEDLMDKIHKYLKV